MPVKGKCRLRERDAPQSAAKIFLMKIETPIRIHPAMNTLNMIPSSHAMPAGVGGRRE